MSTGDARALACLHTPSGVCVVGLGQACVDYRGTVPAFPQEDAKVELQDLFLQCGGPAAMAMVTLARLGVKTAFLGSVGDDAFGQRIRETLLREGVDTSGLLVTPGATSQVAFIALGALSGKRTIFWHRGTAPHLKTGDIHLEAYAGARILHLDGLMVEGATEAATQARRLGLHVVLDAGTYREGHRNLLPLVDTLIASESFALPLVRPGTDLEGQIEVLRALGPREVVITLGARGSIGWQGGRIYRQEAFAVTVRDTTGAGDVYHGAYCYGLLQGWDMPGSMRFASAAAALKCTRTGPGNPMPGLEEVQALLNPISKEGGLRP